MNSRNHHMFSSVGAFLYDLAGLRLAPGSAGWTTAWLWPVVTDHPALPYASGSYNSIAGPFALSWDTSGAAPCVADAAENTVRTLACPGTANKITAITFSSFGTPSGSCASGFTKGACNAANTTSALTALCVGQPSCVVSVDTGFFGDPCPSFLCSVLFRPSAVWRGSRRPTPPAPFPSLSTLAQVSTPSRCWT